MELAPFTKKDFKDALTLIRQASKGLEFVDARVLEAQTFSDPESDISFYIKAVEKKRTVGLALGVARKGPANARTGFVKYAAVAPKSRRKGVGQALFSEMERRFQKREVREVKVGACPPPFLQGGVEVTDTALVAFLLKRGYQRSDTIVDMTADLAKFDPEWSPEDQALLKSAKVRKASAADEKALMDMVAAAFPGWALEVRQGLETGMVYIAEDSGAIASFCCGNSTHPGYYGPTGTLESSRGKGLAKVLLFKTLQDMKKQGFNQARIPWVGPIPFYAKYAGARLGPIYWQFTKRV